MSLRAEYERGLTSARPAMPSVLLSETNLSTLPELIQRYVRISGVLGQPRIRNFRAAWKGRIRGSATSPWLAFTAEQLNTFDAPRRFFMLDATRGEAVWHPGSGAYAYGEFDLVSLAYNMAP